MQMSLVQNIINLYLGLALSLKRVGPTSQKRDLSSTDLLAQRSKRREESEWLRTKLRRFPLWYSGHLELGLISLELDEINVAYPSSLAALELARSNTETQQAKEILARCFMRRGANEKAVELFEELYKGNSSSLSIAEDLAASYISVSRFSEAESVLAKIPDGNLTMSTKTALHYVRQKIEQ